jgi:hypothetical protein
MLKQGCVCVRRLLAVAVAVAMAVGPQIGGAFAAGPVGNVVVRGFVASADKATPISGARVYAVHLDTKQVFTSAPSAGDGAYQITGLPFGYYDLAVETPDGLFLANRVINAPAGEKIEVSLMLGPPQPEDTEWWSAEPDRRIAGLDRVPDGVARIVEGKPRALPPGAVSGAQIATATGATGATSSLTLPLLLAGGVGLLAILIGNQDDNSEPAPVSPFIPSP